MTDSDMYALVAPRITATHGDVTDIEGSQHWWDETILSWVPAYTLGDTWPVNW